MFGCNWGEMFGQHGGFMGGSHFGMIWSVLLLVLVIYLAARLFQGFSNGRQGHRDRTDSLEIIKDKYARGEISTEEYQRMKDILAS